MNAKEIRELFAKHGVPLGKDDVWHVQGNPVVRHSALERLAAALEIVWDEPQFLRTERDECVLLAWGSRKDGVREFSIGEAAIDQNYRVSGKQAAYPYAMAEKRAKDRVIIKLAGLYGAYSSDEMDGQTRDREESAEEPIAGKPQNGGTAVDASPAPAASSTVDAGFSGIASGTTVGEPAEPDMERLLRDIEREPANTDGSLIKMARKAQGLNDLGELNTWLNHPQVARARAEMSPGNASLFLRFIASRKRLLGDDAPMTAGEAEQVRKDPAGEASRRTPAGPSFQEKMLELEAVLLEATTVDQVDELTDSWLESNIPNGVQGWDALKSVHKTAITERERAAKKRINPDWKPPKK